MQTEMESEHFLTQIQYLCQYQYCQAPYFDININMTIQIYLPRLTIFVQKTYTIYI